MFPGNRTFRRFCAAHVTIQKTRIETIAGADGIYGIT